jgi:hypothetical protein
VFKVDCSGKQDSSNKVEIELYGHAKISALAEGEVWGPGVESIGEQEIYVT